MSGRGPRSVRQQLDTLMAIHLVVLVLVGLVGIGAALQMNTSVDYLTHKLEPAIRSNAAVMQDLTDVETQIRGWALSGNRSVLAESRASRSRLERDQARLDRFAGTDARLAGLVDRQQRRSHAWLNDYVFPRLRNGGGPGTFDRQLFDLGLKRFRAIRAVNSSAKARLTALAETARARAHSRLVWTIVAVAVFTLLGVGLGVVIARRFNARVVDPLADLERTVRDLQRGRNDARAASGGLREISQVALAVNDMADRNERVRRAEAEFVASMRELDTVKSDFVSNVSHELRTPLTSITGYLELLTDELAGRLESGEAEMLAVVQRNVDRLRDLIEDLLALTRAESRTTDLEQVDLVGLVRDVVADLGLSASTQGVNLDLAVPHHPVLVLADSSQLSRAVTNLVSNAVKFSRRGGRVEVRLEVVVGETAATVTVADDGIGIPADELPRLGARFYRATNAQERGISGTGLGLRIVQSIMDNHHGSLDLQSVLGAGTTVSIRLPLQAQGTR